MTRLALNEATIFAGSVIHAEIASYYQAADLFVFSSLTDTQGIVVLEAIASGLPVVALKDEAFTSMVKNGTNGFLLRADASPARFARRVAALLENQAQWRRFSAASTRIAGEFSEEKQARRLTRLYSKFVSRRRR